MVYELDWWLQHHKLKRNKSRIWDFDSAKLSTQLMGQSDPSIASRNSFQINREYRLRLSEVIILSTSSNVVTNHSSIYAPAHLQISAFSARWMRITRLDIGISRTHPANFQIIVSQATSSQFLISFSSTYFTDGFPNICIPSMRSQ